MASSSHAVALSMFHLCYHRQGSSTFLSHTCSGLTLQLQFEPQLQLLVFAKYNAQLKKLSSSVLVCCDRLLLLSFKSPCVIVECVETHCSLIQYLFCIMHWFWSSVSLTLSWSSLNVVPCLSFNTQSGSLVGRN